jgi:hypothetical protein
MLRPAAASRLLWPVSGLGLLCLSGLLVAATPGPPPSPVVAWAQAAEWGDFSPEVPIFILDTTPADVPALVGLVTTGTEPQQIAGRYALGYGDVPTEAAIRALDASAKADRGSRRSMLVAALGRRGSPADRAWLIRILEEQPLGADWSAIQAAAYAVGVLRATEATRALERLAALRDVSGARYAEEALRWLRDGPWDVTALPMRTDEDRMIAAALRVGLPDSGHVSIFNDDERGGAWILDGTAWRFRPGGRAADSAHLRFTSRQNAAGTRAVLSAGIVCGMLCGAGYDYVLARDGAGWRVEALVHTWVS